MFKEILKSKAFWISFIGSSIIIQTMIWLPKILK
jgi:hypothetical protein